MSYKYIAMGFPDSENNKENNNTLIDNCKIKIYVLYLNCYSFLTSFFVSINNKLSEHRIYINQHPYMKQYMIEDNIYLLGKKYNPDVKWIGENTKNISFFSYRKNIPKKLSNGLDNDVGWGCMIRTGQMMLCQTLKQVFPENEHNKIISLFFDSPESDFSIHKISDCGANHHVPVGTWFGSTSLGNTLKELVSKSYISSTIEIIMARDGVIYNNEIVDLLNQNKKILILIPVRFGMDKINNSYCKPLLECFENLYNVGIVGGKPRESYYFIGKQNDNIFFLDPHTVQNAFVDFDNIETTQKDNDKISYVDINDIDPCMLLSFLISSENEYNDWKNKVSNYRNTESNYPIFSILDSNEEISDCFMEDSVKEKEIGEWINV